MLKIFLKLSNFELVLLVYFCYFFKGLKNIVTR